MTADHDRHPARRRGATAAALTLAAALPGCDSLFQGFSILPPEEAQRLPVVIDVAAHRDTPAPGDPAVIPLLEGTAASTVELQRVKAEDRPHLHQHADKTLYVLEGHGKLLLDRDWRDLREGMLVEIPRNVPHAYRNEADGGTLFLVTFTPAHVLGDRTPLEYDP